MRFGCGICSLPIGGMVECIDCAGCSERYHLHCMKMNQYQWRVCVDFDNVLWLCDSCLSSFRRKHTSPLENESNVEVQNEQKENNKIELTVRALQSEMSTLKQSIVELQQTVNSGRQPIPNVIAEPCTSTPKKNVNCNDWSSNSNYSGQLWRGSNSENAGTSTQKCWVYFTRVAKHVSTDAMRDMILNALRPTDQPEVVKIVPRWSNLDDLRYISFKVGLNWKDKEKALEKSTWPTGLLFREFVNREHNYWEP